jgi:hypothetical protein
MIMGGILQWTNNVYQNNKPDLASAVPFPVQLVTFLNKCNYLLIIQPFTDYKNWFTCLLIEEMGFARETWEE